MEPLLEKSKISSLKSIYFNYNGISSFDNILYQRHVVTAAHCICPRNIKQTNDELPHPKSLCKKPYNSRNQITPGFNDVTIYGGHKNRVEVKKSKNAENIFKAVHAFIKGGPSSSYPLIDTKEDIGLLVSDRAMFNADKLKLTQPLPFDRPPIIPICLAAENSDYNHEKVVGVGWGLLYKESPVRTNNQDPIYSSCMSNEVGPDKWAFEPCDMNWLKKEIRVQNVVKKRRWACDKNRYPDEVERDIVKCNNYFLHAKRILDKSQISVMEKIDKIYIHVKKINKPIDLNAPIITCYNKKQFTENGWCELQRSSVAWGFCSPSCDEDLLKV